MSCARVMPLSTDSLLARLLAALEAELPAAVELRHRLHAEPELAHEEQRTAAAVAAAHVHPELPWGVVALDPGAVNASSDSVEIIVEGEPSHGAYPHLGRDPVLAIAQIVIALHAQAARRVAPHNAVALNVGVLEGGGAENVIPSRARARASLRAQRPADRVALRRMVEEVVHGIAAAHGCRGAVELVPGEPPLENDPRIVTRARE